MADLVDHPLDFWRKFMLNTSIDLTMRSETQSRHRAPLLLIRIANQAFYLGNSDSIHDYPLNTLSRVTPLWEAIVTGSRNCSSAWNVALTTL
jgi:hypothetical protein